MGILGGHKPATSGHQDASGQKAGFSSIVFRHVYVFRPVLPIRIHFRAAVVAFWRRPFINASLNND